MVLIWECNKCGRTFNQVNCVTAHVGRAQRCRDSKKGYIEVDVPQEGPELPGEEAGFPRNDALRAAGAAELVRQSSSPKGSYKEAGASSGQQASGLGSGLQQEGSPQMMEDDEASLPMQDVYGQDPTDVYGQDPPDNDWEMQDASPDSPDQRGLAPSWPSEFSRWETHAAFAEWVKVTPTKKWYSPYPCLLLSSYPCLLSCYLQQQQHTCCCCCCSCCQLPTFLRLCCCCCCSLVFTPACTFSSCPPPHAHC
jgi:hypothetical protein